MDVDRGSWVTKYDHFQLRVRVGPFPFRFWWPVHILIFLKKFKSKYTIKLGNLFQEVFIYIKIAYIYLFIFIYLTFWVQNRETLQSGSVLLRHLGPLVDHSSSRSNQA
jgi:hypothetical protein